MAKKQKKKKGHGGLTIANNKIARHEYLIESTHEAGLVLQGWEIKSLREGRVQLKESYITFQKGEAWLVGSHMSPLLSASTHITPNPTRQRKLLLHDYEIIRLQASVDRKGHTVVPISLYWKNNRVKVEIGVGKGKKLHDKRASAKDKDWNRNKARLLKG